MTDAIKPCPACSSADIGSSYVVGMVSLWRTGCKTCGLAVERGCKPFDTASRDAAMVSAEAAWNTRPAARDGAVAWLRDAHEGEGDECLVPAAKGDPGAFPVYDSPSEPLVPVERQEVVDVIDDAIADSIDEGWRTADGAKAVVKALEALRWVVVGPKEEGRPAADSVPRSAP